MPDISGSGSVKFLGTCSTPSKIYLGSLPYKAIDDDWLDASQYWAG